ncbi:tRNA 2-thiouridine(34) synthase MnmA [Oleidesulfovibrio sp.]|uniref:tRNA 2-thiouridine(34) synthase MnmA n=1 Tax=Oleidesulfovibrio sp. TaxID=2909707 RepID=UPI003A8BEF41
MHIAVAVSGGTDSLFTLLQLLEEGHQVTALHAHFLSPHKDPQKTKSNTECIEAACRNLGADFRAIDLSAQFEQAVIKPFIEAYRNGRTPNPCAMCNASMKFGMLLDAALNLGAEAIATGHYAKISSPAGSSEECTVTLVQGEDSTKDQSYFLSLVPCHRLTKAIFPLGSWKKQDVKAELARRGIVPPLPSESQEICFVPDDDYRAFLHSKTKILPGAGPMVLRDGHVVGHHNGLWQYTEGQRRGLGIAWSEPLYVLEKDTSRNALVVGPKAELSARGCFCSGLNMLVPHADWPQEVFIKTRYRQTALPVEVTLDVHEATMRVTFDIPRTPPAAGQVATVYDAGGRVLAGGIIEGIF